MSKIKIPSIYPISIIQSLMSNSKKEEMIINEIICGIKILQIKFIELEKKCQSSRIWVRQKLEPIKGIVHKSMQCNSIDCSIHRSYF